MDTVLLIVGFPKCGTSSLYYWLSDHPDICASNPKETFFFIDKECEFQPPWKTFHNGGNFDTFFKIEDERICLEASPFHFDQNTCFDYAVSNQNVKVIFMLRTPELRLYSCYLFFTQVIQGINIESFSEYIEMVNSKDKLRRSSREKRFDYILHHSIEWGRYAKYLDKWKSALGEKNIFVGTMEEMEIRPLELMRKLCSWLDVSSKYYDDYNFKVINKSYSVRFPDIHKRLREMAGFNPMCRDELDTYLNSFYFLRSKGVRQFTNYLYSMFQIKKNQMTLGDRRLLAEVKDMYEMDNLALLNGYDIKY
ncbi:hypothetical protein BTA51_09415 [Hahella sp. CCB-MM4]|uniref:sulfotransferase domain-containing protein n=1 Tax=Hahella sp. (strain CCB-MM4) TaxID=1926491 RepID=UPI000B9A2913|nr:sulfotransferase domain-containing protein [Hahella sp. CCB-MM4]OZG73988.1 hypothetical protein BTA51_09415 [Hahella sp. CCB-MM4]